MPVQENFLQIGILPKSYEIRKIKKVPTFLSYFHDEHIVDKQPLNVPYEDLVIYMDMWVNCAPSAAMKMYKQKSWQQDTNW